MQADRIRKACAAYCFCLERLAPLSSVLHRLSQAKVIALAQRALGKTDADMEAARQEIVRGVPAKVAGVVADMLNANCECRKRLADAANKMHEEHITSLGDLRGRLVGLVEHSYASVSTNLLREIRIFTGSNAAAFALLTLVTLLRKGAALQLALPAFVLVGAVAVSAGLYLFHQNWLHTVLYGEYVGMAYVAYLGGVAAFLADVLLNRARVSTQLVNAGLNVIGAAATAVPC